MMSTFLKANPLMTLFNTTLIKLPTPANISTLWNFGSLMFMSLMIQLISGLFLASAYTSSLDSSFQLVSQTMEYTDKGWVLRQLHASGASMYFFFLYIHIARALYYGSYLYKHVWFIGVTILLLSMATAFMGYVLPMNQMSYWGASVITNLFSEVPYLGPTLVQFMWGGVSVDSPTIMRFFTFHFVLPFFILALTMAHITFLHQSGSSNPLGITSTPMKTNFNFFFSLKDFLGISMALMIFLFITLYHPLLMSDYDNFNPADSSTTPQHIQPEWYFLFAYAILRSIPNKLGGVMALAFSVLVLYTLPLLFMAKLKSTSFYPMNMLIFWSFLVIVLLLTWIGARPVEQPYIYTGQILTFLYFSYYIFMPLASKSWDIFKS
uniref:Cytochrome b n=1 Tax=Gammarus pisinnus TaxID=1486748 RepID=A0A517LS70_9CRUS|nr:cytochrome b [Gammarus pisinnus]QDS78474.1 cytochrome b [Gammarus pisinnus]